MALYEIRGGRRVGVVKERCSVDARRPGEMNRGSKKAVSTLLIESRVSVTQRASLLWDWWSDSHHTEEGQEQLRIIEQTEKIQRERRYYLNSTLVPLC